MRFSWVVSVALGVGVMLSPEALVLLGNNAGAAGRGFLAAVVVAAVVHGLTAASYDRLFARFPGPATEARFLREALGSITGTALPLCSRATLAVCISTGMLATAGFVFNETFVYWFPNFGFAFLLLGVLLAVNLLGPRVSGALQVGFVGIVVAGLLVLSVIGLVKGGSAPEPATGFEPALGLRPLLLGLVLLVGYDLSVFRGEQRPRAAGPVRPMVACLVVVTALFVIWGGVSTAHVASDKLAGTTIPYTVAARTILGQPGRLIMGVVVIAAVCSAVNALFAGVSRMMADMAGQRLLPRLLAFGGERAPLPLLMLAGGTAAMMAAGMAGEPELEVFVRAGLLFWLLGYAAVHASALLLADRPTDGPGSPGGLGWRIAAPGVGLVATLGGFVGLLWTDGDRRHLVVFMVEVLAIALTIGLLQWVASRGTSRAAPV